MTSISNEAMEAEEAALKARVRAKWSPPPPEYCFLHRWDPERYAEGYLRAGLSEAKVQAAIVEVLRVRHRAVVTEIDSGDRRLRGRAAAAIRGAGGDPRVLKGRGTTMERGISDLAVTLPGGQACWIEVKTPALYRISPATGRLIQARAAGSPTVEQLRFLQAQQRRGAVVGVAWAVSDLDAILPAGLGLTPPGYRVEAIDEVPIPTEGGKDLSKGPP